MSTYTPIASVTLSSAQSSVTFGGIPQTYTDLVLVISGGNASSGPSVQVRFNGDSGSNYSWTTLSSGGGSTLSDKGTGLTTAILSYFGVPFTTLGGQTQVTHFMNYSNSTTNKTFLSRASNNQFGTDAIVGLWRNTSAITSINLYNSNSTDFTSGSTFNLYGINAQESAQAKAYGGDTIITDGTYWYHVFRSSGTFATTQALTADCLVVAGGGGSGQNNGGGGGAGGLVYTSSVAFATTTNYTITIGAGGAGATSASDLTSRGSSGSNSNITGGSLSLTAAVGGGGAGGQGTGGNALSGGSGGGGGNGSTVRATGTSGQGNQGGLGTNTNRFPGGGGGGAGAAGGDAAANGTTGGQGGNGSSSYSSWGAITGTGHNVSGTYYYAGGGSGAGNTALAGGYGGGGTGGIWQGSPAIGTAGMANTGGGAGGSTGSSGVPTIAGGSGIVIIRYAA